MEQHAWFNETIQRIMDFAGYPDKANEFRSAKVPSQTARTAISLLCTSMLEDSEPPRVEPTADGGLRMEWHEYWIDMDVVIGVDGKTAVELRIEGVVPHAVSEQGLTSLSLFSRGLKLLSELKKKGAPAPKPTADPGGLVR